MHKCHIILSSVACRVPQYFSTLPHKRPNFRRRTLVNTKSVFWFSLQLFFFGIFLTLGITQRDIILNVQKYWCKVRVILVRVLWNFNFLDRFDVCGSVHRSIIHIEITNKMQQYIKIYYSMFKWGLTCFGRYTAHHQELKTALAASGFAYVRDCWTLRSNNLSRMQNQKLLVQFWAPDDGRCIARNMLSLI